MTVPQVTRHYHLDLLDPFSDLLHFRRLEFCVCDEDEVLTKGRSFHNSSCLTLD